MSPHLPPHLLSSWFAEGAPVPTFMIQDPHWMTSTLVLDDPVWVRFPDGEVWFTEMPTHIAKYVLTDHAIIIAEPKIEP